MTPYSFIAKIVFIYSTRIDYLCAFVFDNAIKERKQGRDKERREIESMITT